MANGSADAQELRDIDASVPHSARIWNYWLGGKDNFAADREAGDEFLAVYPGQRDKARAVRHFLARAVRYLVVEAGVRQFLDVGTGLPTADNTHEVAQRLAPESRIVYVDNDPLVLAHARILLTSSPEGVTNYIDADLHDPARILAEAGKTLDLDQPVALLLIGVLGHVADDDEARSIVAPPAGRAAAGQLPGAVRRHRHRSRLRRRARAVPRQRRRALQRPQPRADRELLRRAGARSSRASCRSPGGGRSRTPSARRRTSPNWAGSPARPDAASRPTQADNAEQSGQGAPSGSIIGAAVTTCPHRAT